MDTPEQSEITAPASGTDAAYARLNSRVNALLVDTAIIGLVFIILIIVGSATEDIPGSGRIFIVLTFAWLLLYEPVQVWRYGSTIGHRRANLRVVADSTGSAPTFPVSFARFLVKSFLGFPSFISMAFTRRHQAMHDLLTGTTVQLRDLSIATSNDYLRERVPETVTVQIPATRRRRTMVTLVYIVGAYVASGLLSLGLVSEACRLKGDCSTVDSANSRLITYIFLAGAVAIATLGLRGRLRGTRAREETAPVSAPAEETDNPC
jgi:uncharacterized RDD family membrane protein YckC